MTNKNTFFLFINIYNVGYLLKHKFCFTLTVTYNVGYFNEKYNLYYS